MILQKSSSLHDCLLLLDQLFHPPKDITITFCALSCFCLFLPLHIYLFLEKLPLSLIFYDVLCKLTFSINAQSLLLTKLMILLHLEIIKKKWQKYPNSFQQSNVNKYSQYSQAHTFSPKICIFLCKIKLVIGKICWQENSN